MVSSFYETREVPIAKMAAIAPNTKRFVIDRNVAYHSVLSHPYS